jgi:hypothetical protein
MPNVVRFAACVDGRVIVSIWHGGSCVFCAGFVSWRDALSELSEAEWFANRWPMKAEWRICVEGETC